MRMEELQTGFFGYRKESVYQLIASMEENFSSKLMEKDAQHTKAMQDAQIKIAELETELRTVRAEHLSSRKDQDMISDTLLDAQAYAQKLRAESISQEQQLRGPAAGGSPEAESPVGGLCPAAWSAAQRHPYAAA